MKQNKDFIIAWIIKQECNPGEEMTGSYHCAKNDKGGCTKFGVAQRSHPSLDIKNLSRDQAIVIYQKEYWDQVDGDNLPVGIDLIVTDFAVTSGPGRAVKMYQDARSMVAESVGEIGAETIAYKSTVVVQYEALREKFYNSIAEKDPSQKANLADWIWRLRKAVQAARSLLLAEQRGNKA